MAKFNGHRCEKRNMDEVCLGMSFDALGRGQRIKGQKAQVPARPNNYIDNPTNK